MEIHKRAARRPGRTWVVGEETVPCLRIDEEGRLVIRAEDNESPHPVNSHYDFEVMLTPADIEMIRPFLANHVPQVPQPAK